MNTKIIIAATVAALSLATTAFAGEGGGYYQSPSPASPYASGQVGYTGAAQYPAANRGFAQSGLNNATLPENGQNGPVESPNALPAGAMVGTAAYINAQSVDRYFAQQADRRFAQTRRLQPNG